MKNHVLLNPLLIAIALLVAIMSAVPLYAESIKPQVTFIKEVALRYPKTYRLRFSLWDAQTNGAKLWSEEAKVKLNSAALYYNLGGVDPVKNPLSEDFFEMQLWVQVEQAKGGTWKIVGTRTLLAMSPYAFTAKSALSGSVTEVHLQDQSVTASKLANGAVTDSKISGVISASKIESTIARTTDVTAAVEAHGHAGVYQTANEVTAAIQAHNHDGEYQAEGAAALGDLGGNYPGPSVTKLQGRSISSAAPASGQALRWNGSAWAPSADYARVVIVSPGATAADSGTNLRNAVAAINDASSSKTYLLKIEPGSYALGASALSLKQYIDIEGSGEDVTILSGAVAGLDQAIVRGASNSEIRHLQIQSTNTPLALSNVSTRVTHVTTVCSGAVQAEGIYIWRGAPVLTDVTATASGSGVMAGIKIESSASVELNRVRASAGTSAGYGIYLLASSGSPLLTARDLVASGTSMGVYNSGGTLTISNSSISASCSIDCKAVSNVSDGSVTIRWSRLSASASGAVTAYGMYNDNSSAVVSHSYLEAANGAQNYGIRSARPSGSSTCTVKVDQSVVVAATSIATNSAGCFTYIGNSKLDGGNTSDPNIKCVGNYDEAYDQVPCIAS